MINKMVGEHLKNANKKYCINIIYSIFKLIRQEPAMDEMCNFLRRFFEIFYFSLEVHRNVGDSGCSNVWELMSL